MEIVLNASLGIGLLMFLILVSKRGKKREDYFFLSWILVTLLQIAFYNVTIFHGILKGPISILGFGLPLLGAPLLFLYILQLTGKHPNTTTIFAHCSVYCIYITVLCLFLLTDDVEIIAQNGYLSFSGNTSIWSQFYAIPLALSGLFYCIWDLTLLKKHRRTIAAIFSFNEKIHLKWVSCVVYSYLTLFLLASFLIFGATQFRLFPLENAFAFVGITLGGMLIAFGFYGFRQTSIFSSTDSKILQNTDETLSTDKTAYAKSGLTSDKIQILATKLSRVMETKKPFLNENLSLSSLADLSETTQTQLSQVINQYFEMNFYDFVNQYRVEESKKMLSSPKFNHLSILGIAFDCGFKSKSSFNRYFKKYVGVSPSQFRNK